MRKIIYLPSLTLLTACGGSSSDSTGQFSIGVTDGPVEGADSVIVSFTSVELQGPERTLIEFDEARTINLLDYQREERVLLLDGEVLPAGDYQWIRLGVDEEASSITVDGSLYPLEIPSSAQTGLKMNRGFTIAAGSVTDFTIDFDMRKSVHLEGTGDYKLRPTLRLVDNLEVNTINGTIDDSLVTDLSCNNGDNNDTGNTVYLFTGTDSTIQDIQGSDGDPLATATVNYSEANSQYEFVMAWVNIRSLSHATRHLISILRTISIPLTAALQ